MAIAFSLTPVPKGREQWIDNHRAGFRRTIPSGRFDANCSTTPTPERTFARSRVGQLTQQARCSLESQLAGAGELEPDPREGSARPVDQPLEVDGGTGARRLEPAHVLAAAPATPFVAQENNYILVRGQPGQKYVAGVSCRTEFKLDVGPVEFGPVHSRFELGDLTEIDRPRDRERGGFSLRVNGGQRRACPGARRDSLDWRQRRNEKSAGLLVGDGSLAIFGHLNRQIHQVKRVRAVVQDRFVPRTPDWLENAN